MENKQKRRSCIEVKADGGSILNCVIMKCVAIVLLIACLSLRRDALISMNNNPVGILPESVNIF